MVVLLFLMSNYSRTIGYKALSFFFECSVSILFSLYRPNNSKIKEEIGSIYLYPIKLMSWSAQQPAVMAEPNNS